MGSEPNDELKIGVLFIHDARQTVSANLGFCAEVRAGRSTLLVRATTPQ
jgi:hypothetical protein